MEQLNQWQEDKMSEKISSFKDLRVYKLAFEVQQEIFGTSKRFPSEETLRADGSNPKGIAINRREHR